MTFYVSPFTFLGLKLNTIIGLHDGERLVMPTHNSFVKNIMLAFIFLIGGLMCIGFFWVLFNLPWLWLAAIVLYVALIGKWTMYQMSLRGYSNRAISGGAGTNITQVI